MKKCICALFVVVAMATSGSKRVELVSRDGGRAVADAYGARLVSWRPAGGEEVLAMAWPYAKCPRGEQIHGGLPLYWPWFVFEGPDGCKIHGVTSYAVWKVKERSKARVVMELDDNGETRAVWPHRFHAELEYALDGGVINDALLSLINASRTPIRTPMHVQRASIRISGWAMSANVRFRAPTVHATSARPKPNRARHGCGLATSLADCRTRRGRAT